jgi:alkylation response protein AidB-like acyl-CoA dehydrogenase
MFTSANMSLTMYSGLSRGAYSAIFLHGSEEHKQLYLPKLASCEWTGTMNLTEPQSGTDLSTIKTKAIKENGHYKIFGQKIYITYGEHDLSENIVHHR